MHCGTYVMDFLPSLFQTTSKIFECKIAYNFLCITLVYVFQDQKNRLVKITVPLFGAAYAVLLSTYNICFGWEQRKLIESYTL